MLSTIIHSSITMSQSQKSSPQATWLRAFTQGCLVVSLSASMLCMSLTSVHANPYTEAQKRFSAYRDRVFQLQSNENTKYLSGELSTLNQWISQAERHLREEDEDEFVRSVRLIQAQVRLVDTCLEELDAREQLLKLHEEAKRTETKAKNEREAVVEIEKLMGGSLNRAPVQQLQVPVQPTQTPTQQRQVGGR